MPETRPSGKENNYTRDIGKEKEIPGPMTPRSAQSKASRSQEILNVSPSQNVPCYTCSGLMDKCFTLTCNLCECMKIEKNYV